MSGVFPFSSNASDINNHEFAEVYPEVYSLLDDSIDANTSNADSEDEKPRSLPQIYPEVYSLLDDSIDANTSNADSEDEKPRSLPQSNCHKETGKGYQDIFEGEIRLSYQSLIAEFNIVL
ncbi:predicted protein [Nematostella vectensis]|uniref:Uncharacterized protein n=1 Tax=Nematostella vectensis TaxID=45351 RepID=A7T6S7_NEMVE|nr:predicted protein [Nematostella vectensis]|eukprot:XP_001620428.1 hypothetical protein NEMVEDRAFT_v1g248786 [Nematostella vectensis]